ncbi:MAG: T9SS type A sorting domain-containing protein [Gemmatimonadota bacterium]|nr:MAG: T9SS type A sorting domain-containing protein [Gemmatimonadota bacterium]
MNKKSNRKRKVFRNLFPRTRNRKLIWLISAVLFMSLHFSVAQAQYNTLQHDGLERIYYVHVPFSYDGSYPYPLVIGLHALGGGAMSIENNSRFGLKGNAEDFFVVYPEGINGSWNSGQDNCYASRNNIDDVGFISSLIDTLLNTFNIDSTRIYVTGHSIGSMTTYHIAAELSDRIAAVGPVAGQMTLDTINPIRPIPIIHFHALNDQSVPFYGGMTGCGPVRPVQEVLNLWIGINGCNPFPDTIYNENGVIGRKWTAMTSNADIVLYTLPSGGHDWPGELISATDVMWDFFLSHSIPSDGPSPYFQAEPRTGKAPLSVQFTDRSSSLDPITEWAWDFDLDGTIDSYNQHPTWIFDEPGIYSVSLEVTNSLSSKKAYRSDHIRVFGDKSSLFFKNEESIATCPTTPDHNLSETVSIEAWIHPFGWGRMGGFGLGRIIDKGQFSLFLIGDHPIYTDHSLGLQITHPSGIPTYSYSPDHSITLNTWQHVAATYDGSSSEVKLYINGIEQALTYFPAPSGLIADNSNNDIIIGNDASGSFTFNGLIDELRLWETIRTEDEVCHFMDEELDGTGPGLLGYWKMNEGEGETLLDQTTNNLNGTLTQTLFWDDVSLGWILTDSDEDGVTDCKDNCVSDSNPGQEDSDGDETGDVCDSCPETYNPEQTDTDGDGSGDACDTCTDTDNDGYGDPGYGDTCEEDNCPTVYNPDQIDSDGDGTGDACELERGDVDGNGSTNVLDVLAIVNHILDIQPLEGDAWWRADCNSDASINVLDVLGVVNVILGIGDCSQVAGKPIVNDEAMEFLRRLEGHLSPEDFTSFMEMVKATSLVQEEYSLKQNYPNPFNPLTELTFDLPEQADARLAVYNILGQIVEVLIDEELPAGKHAVKWDGGNMASGVYFYRLEANDYASTKRMLLMK